MTYIQKFKLIQELGSATVGLDFYDQWYVFQPTVEVSDGCFLDGRSGRGPTVEDAINAHWSILTNLQPHETIRVRGNHSAQDFRWDGTRFALVDRTQIPRNPS